VKLNKEISIEPIVFALRTTTKRDRLAICPLLSMVVQLQRVLAWTRRRT